MHSCSLGLTAFVALATLLVIRLVMNDSLWLMSTSAGGKDDLSLVIRLQSVVKTFCAS